MTSFEVEMFIRIGWGACHVCNPLQEGGGEDLKKSTYFGEFIEKEFRQKIY